MRHSHQRSVPSEKTAPVVSELDALRQSLAQKRAERAPRQHVIDRVDLPVARRDELNREEVRAPVVRFAIEGERILPACLDRAHAEHRRAQRLAEAPFEEARDRRPECCPSHANHRSTAARSRTPVGAKSARPATPARYPKIAFDSHSTNSPSSKMGTFPFGFFARICGVRVSPLNTFTVCSVNGTPSSYANATTF